MAFSAKPLAFPKLHSFRDFFESAKPWKHDVGRGHEAKGVEWRTKDPFTERMTTIRIGPYLSVDSPHESFEVKPKAFLIDWIKKNMLPVADDVFSYKVVARSSKQALLIVQYGRILGDRWLAYIDPKTIPRHAGSFKSRTSAAYGERPYREITRADVGKAHFRAFGRVWPVADFIGRIMAQDVGKRVYKVGDIVQVENNEQRARRLAR